jgi:hypothetical protein
MPEWLSIKEALRANSTGYSDAGRNLLVLLNMAKNRVYAEVLPLL